ncbi:glycosyltransferase family 4 protein [Flavobacterium sp. KACC 22763]|uniref:glycosyltransferase family 4 protein n=1 Tax=Flavobacterium sp. KACC 22763 TaxID=3025668 RepID=UPI002365C70E|nr:glycosyltransferase [Flavobacterium sp. KACC 22763]WDF62859.1 glycosyltransferase [Flavobacterium sp. KACC 22763]
MRTILIAHNYTESSFAYMSYYLAKSMALEGNKVIFISHKPFFAKSFEEKMENGKLLVYSWPTEDRPVKFKDALWYSKLFLEHKPEVIISHFVNVNITAIISKLLSFNKAKVFPYYHTLSNQINKDVSTSSLKRNIKKYRKQLLYKWFANLVICPSELAKEDLKQCFFRKNSIKVLNPMKDRFSGKRTLNSSPIIVSYLGRLEPSKGVVELMEAFIAYKKKCKSSKIVLNIAGNGSQYIKILELSKEHDYIRIKGALPYNEIDQYLNKSHYTIIPSLIDNLPTVGLESMMNQTPLLISNNTGLANELEDGGDCFKFEPTFEEMLILFQRVENNKNNIAMGVNARKTYMEKFGIEEYCKKMKEVIES